MLGGSGKDGISRVNSDLDLWAKDFSGFEDLMDQDELNAILAQLPSLEEKKPQITPKTEKQEKIAKDESPLIHVEPNKGTEQQQAKVLKISTNMEAPSEDEQPIGKQSKADNDSKHDSDKAKTSDSKIRQVATQIKGKKITLKINLKKSSEKLDQIVDKVSKSEVKDEEEEVMPRSKIEGDGKDEYKPSAKVKKAAGQVKEYTIKTRSRVVKKLTTPKKQGYNQLVVDDVEDDNFVFDDEELLASEQSQSEEQEDMARTKRQVREHQQHTQSSDPDDKNVEEVDEKKEKRREYRRNRYYKKKQELINLKKAVADLTEVKKLLEAEAEENEVRIEELEGEVESLQQQLVAFQNKTDTSERDKLASQVKQLERALHESEEKIEKYYKPLCFEQHARINTLEQKNLELQMQNSEMGSKLRQAKIASIEAGEKPILNVFEFQRAKIDEEENALTAVSSKQSKAKPN